MSLRLAYWSAAPEALKAMSGVGEYIRKSGLDMKLVDFVYLRVSQINGCAYCCDIHSHDLRKAGETDQRIDCLAGWRESSFYTDRERAALGWAESLTKVIETHADDEAYAAARAAFNDKELADLTFAISLMNAWNRIGVGLRHGPKPRKD